MRAPVSQISAAASAAATEQLAFVAPLGQGGDDAAASWPGVPSILLEHEGKVLADELRSRNAPLAGGAGEQPIVFRVERNRRRLFPR